jgi:hypothetical protein
LKLDPCELVLPHHIHDGLPIKGAVVDDNHFELVCDGLVGQLTEA